MIRWAAIGITILLMLTLMPASTAIPVPENDAGSGGDAPDEPTPEVIIQPGTIYEGRHIPWPLGDYGDYYAFVAQAGQVIDARAWGTSLTIHDENGQEIGWRWLQSDALTAVAVAEIPRDGIYYLEANHIPLNYLPDYRLAFAIDARAPWVAPGIEPRTPHAGAMGPSNDAGSGTDAPNEPSQELAIQAGRFYEATLHGAAYDYGIDHDNADYYAIEAKAGQTMRVVTSLTSSRDGECLDIMDEQGNDLGACTWAPTNRYKSTYATIPADGTYMIRAQYLDQTPVYEFFVEFL